jgi:hypothetical protein
MASRVTQTTLVVPGTGDPKGRVTQTNLVVPVQQTGDQKARVTQTVLVVVCRPITTSPRAKSSMII